MLLSQQGNLQSPGTPTTSRDHSGTILAMITLAPPPRPPSCRQPSSSGARCRQVTAKLNDKPVTNDQGPDHRNRRSGPSPATSPVAPTGFEPALPPRESGASGCNRSEGSNQLVSGTGRWGGTAGDRNTG